MTKVKGEKIGVGNPREMSNAISGAGGGGGHTIHYTCTIILMKELKIEDTDQKIIMGLVIIDGNKVTRLHVSN